MLLSGTGEHFSVSCGAFLNLVETVLVFVAHDVFVCEHACACVCVYVCATAWACVLGVRVGRERVFFFRHRLFADVPLCACER